MGKGVEEWVRLEGGFPLCCEQLCEGLLLGRGTLPPAAPASSPAVGCFCRWGCFGPGTGRPAHPRPHPGRPGFSSIPGPFRGGARGSGGVSMTTLCVWEGQMWGLPARGPFLGDHLSMSPT